MSADRTDNADPITRQLTEYWAAWGRAMNDSMGRGQAGGPWTGTPGGFEAGGPWMAAIHQLARKALEQGLDSAGIAAAWRQILKGNGLWPQWPCPDASQVRSVEQLFSPWLDSPAFGPAREHLSRWQTLARQQLDALSEAAPLGQAIDAMMEAAIAVFETRLRQHETEGKPLQSARSLFDLWIEAAEQAWEEMASGQFFAEATAQASAAQLQLQQTAQAELARFCQAVGLPTRTEVDQAHQRIVSLERELDRLRAVIESRAADAASTFTTTASSTEGAHAGKAARPVKSATKGEGSAAATRSNGSTANRVVKPSVAGQSATSAGSGRPAKAAKAASRGKTAAVAPGTRKTGAKASP